jgi:hypothetical protein
MSEPADNETIPCDEILFRAILKKKHLSNGKVEADAFLLREQDAGKLSTYRKKLVTLADCRASFKSCVGVVTLHTGCVRETGQDKNLTIDVIGDALPDDPIPGHASIVNLPEPDVDPILAEWIASQLRDQSRPATEPATPPLTETADI